MIEVVIASVMKGVIEGVLGHDQEGVLRCVKV